MEKIAEVKGEETGIFLNEFIGETSGCTLYMQSAIYYKKEHMKILCEYGYDPTFVYHDKDENPVPFSLIAAPYGGSTFDDLVKLNDDLCTIYNKNKLDAQLLEKPATKQKKI